MLFTGLCLALAVPVLAQPAPRPFHEGTHVVIVGEISSQPRNLTFIHEGKMQVAVGPDKVDHTLHLDRARIYGMHGQELAKSDLRDKWWVRAEGTLMNDPRRIQVERLDVIARDWETYRRSAYFKSGWERGYVERVAGSRQEFAPDRLYPTTRLYPEGTRVAVVGKITSQPRNLTFVHEHKIQVKVGADDRDYTLHLEDAQLRGTRGQEMALSDLRDQWWVRAEGTVMDDSRRIHVDRLQILGQDWGTYSHSPYFRSGEDRGYIQVLEVPGR